MNKELFYLNSNHRIVNNNHTLLEENVDKEHSPIFVKEKNPAIITFAFPYNPEPVEKIKSVKRRKWNIVKKRLEEIYSSLNMQYVEPKNDSANDKFGKWIINHKLFKIHEIYIYVISLISIRTFVDINGAITFGEIGIFICLLIAVVMAFLRKKRKIIYYLIFMWWVPQLISIYSEVWVNGNPVQINNLYKAYMIFNASISLGGKTWAFQKLFISLNIIAVLGITITKVSKRFYIQETKSL